MKPTIIFFLILACSLFQCGYAQKTILKDSIRFVVTETGDKQEDLKELEDKKKVESPYRYIGSDYGIPYFLGGENALKKYVQDSLHYPLQAVKDSIEGKVMVRFTIMKNGYTDSIQIMGSLSPECDAEVVRIIRNMPRWIANNKKGIIIPSTFYMPIYFKFEE